MKISRINTTHVKGTALRSANLISVKKGGVRENRRFYFINKHGAMINGKRAGELVRLDANYDEKNDSLSIASTDGESVVGPIVRTSDRVVTDFYGRGVEGTVIQGPWADAVKRWMGLDLRVVEVDEGVTAADVYPVTIITRATIDSLKERSNGPESRWADRFRMLFEVSGGDPFAEERWEGKLVQAGGLMMKIEGPVPRCVVTTQNPVTGVRDFSTLAAIKNVKGEITRALNTPSAHLPDGGKLTLGMYASVVEEGEVGIGDDVSVLS